MHFEVLVEDQSGSITGEAILEKILGSNGWPHSWRVHHYKGIGRIPKGLAGVTDPAKRILLDRLPAVLRGYGQSLQDPSAVIVVVDLDDKDCIVFKHELISMLNACSPRPRALFRIAIEESEAWLLGDGDAVRAAYPKAKESVLSSYVQDGICGTWEVLADAVHPGGLSRLKKSGYPEVGKAKSRWAREIVPHMKVGRKQLKEFSGLSGWNQGPRGHPPRIVSGVQWAGPALHQKARLNQKRGG